MLSAGHSKQKEVNRSYLWKILQNVIYLACQGLPMRGNWVSVEGGIGCEENSTFHQLMLLCANDDETILNIMRQKMCKYTAHHIQNEILQIMALQH